MKGKGEVTTYWLTAAETNPEVNEQGLSALDEEIKRVLYKADFGTRERCSKERMEIFSPRKMQKVAVSLDRLAMDVMKQSSLMGLLRDDSVPDFAKKELGCTDGTGRMPSINLDELLDDNCDLPEATNRVYDALSTVFESINDMSEVEVKQQISRQLTTSPTNSMMSSDSSMLIELEEI